MENGQLTIPTEGEQYIKDFLESIGIKYEFQKVVTLLKFDTKEYRIADFYLPKFKIYIEFLGLWNNYGNSEYKIKKQVYKQNNIPCIYLYPDNLGIIEYTFDKRIQVELKQNGLIKELQNYLVFKFKKSQFKNHLLYVVLALGVIIYKLISNSRMIDEFILIGVMIIIAADQILNIRNIYLNIFKRNKFYLNQSD